MNTQNIATLIGATGLIGNEILQILLSTNEFSTIKLITRRPLQINNPKVTIVLIDFANLNEYNSALAGSDVVFCAIGTTQKKVKGNKIEYKKIDFDIPVHAAQFCEQNGCKHFSLVSSVGANKSSSIFYTKLKGEVEDAVSKAKIPSIAIYRPSMLLGNRKEFRFGEIVAKPLAILFTFLTPSKFKPIQAKEVAKAMIQNAISAKKGTEIYHYKEITQI